MVIMPDGSLESLDWPHKPTLVFSMHFVLTHVRPEGTSYLVIHPNIAPNQAHLISMFYRDELSVRNTHIVSMSVRGRLDPIISMEFIFIFHA